MKRVKWILGLILVLALLAAAATAMADDDWTQPTAKSVADLTYTGSEIALINPGTTTLEETKWQYTTKDNPGDDDWSDSIPTATDVLSPAVTVYYRLLVPGESPICSGNIANVNLNQATITENNITWPTTSVPYTGSAPDAPTGGSVTGGSASDYDVTWFWVNSESTWDVGSYKAKVTVTIHSGKEDNYTQSSYEFISDNSPLSITAIPLEVSWTYDSGAWPTTAQIYDGTDHTIAATVAVASGSTYTGTLPEIQCSPTTARNQDTYNCSASFKTETTNFTLSNTAASVTINPYQLTYTWKVDDGDVFEFDYVPGATHSVTVSADIFTADSGVTVTPSGAPTAWTAGTHVITAGLTGNDSGNYTEPSTKTKDVVINKISLENATVVLGTNEYTYNGNAHEPTVTSVTPASGGDAVASGEYSVGYTNNINASETAPTVTVTAVDSGNYTGSASTTFKINPKSISSSGITIEPDPIRDQPYTGSEIEPELTIKDGNTTLVKGEDKDYTLSYTNNLNVGDRPTATITGKGNYTGETQLRNAFTITPITIGLNWKLGTSTTLSCVYDGSDHASEAAVTATGYVQTETPPELTVTLNLAEMINVREGGYEATASFADPNVKNYVLPEGDGKKATYFITPKSIANVTFDDIANQTFNGSAITVDDLVVVTDSAVPPEKQTLTKGTDYTIGYEDNTEAGTATITITGCGNYDSQTTATTTFTIEPKSIENVNFAQIDNQTYNGSAITVDDLVVVTDSAVPPEKQTLTKGTDYTIGYEDNTEAGTATITITGRGNYDSQTTATTTFTIDPKSIVGVTFAPIENQTYTGSAITVDDLVVVTDEAISAIPLVQGEDYTITGYADNINKGTATITITGCGNYNLTTTTTFEIVSKSIEDVTFAPIANQTYTGSAITVDNLVVVTDKSASPTPLVQGTDYTITGYANNINKGTATITITGCGNYDPTTTATTTFIIDPKSIQAVWADPVQSQTYTGHELTPPLTITDRDRAAELKLDTDYTVKYEENINVADKPIVTVTGTGNYTDSFTTTFTIDPKDIGDKTISIDPITDQTYTGSGLEPKPVVKDSESGKTLAEGTDYTLSYSSNINVGTATVTVTGIGNYTKTNSAEFKIVPKPIDADDVKITPIDDQEYTGFALTPKITVTDVTGVLKEGTDFEVAYAANINVADKPVVTVTGIGNYGKSRTTTFTIVPKPVKLAWVKDIDNQTYTGYKLEPTLTITDPDRAAELKLDKDFTVKYEDNINVADKPIVTVTGIENYKDSFTTTFTIDPKDIGDESIVFAAIDDQVYTTKPIEPTLTVTDKNREDEKLVLDEDYTVKYSNNVDVSDTTLEKAAKATITGTGNYTGTNSTTFIIIRKPVKKITFTVNGPTEDPIRLGGPDESKYHTIDIDAEAGEEMTVIISDDGTTVTTIKGVTAGTLTIKSDAINGVNLDLSGDKTYKIEAEYVDKANLTTAETTSASAEPAEGADAKFIYDKTAKAITVKPLYNRAAKGVGVALPEGYRLVQFTSTGAGVDFIATNPTSLAAGDHTIPFNVGENPKLKSTAKGGTFTGKYEDYVGNAGTVDTQEILKSSGTISIDAVEPNINDAGRIANTASLTFTVRMNADGGYSEEVTGSVFGTRTLTQGEQTITVSSSSLAADVTNTPSLAFDDLEGSAIFRSFIFDPVCDDPVLTFMPYAGCYYLMGVAEPYAQLTMEVNGEKVTGAADAFGVFALKMPLVEEGDVITLKAIDQAGNVTVMTYVVEAETDAINMVTFMAGRVYTSAHNAKPGDKVDWTMILTVSVDDLKAGKVNVPIYAGNMVSIGTMSVKMDESNNLSYSYTVDEGAEILNEKFIANTKLDKDAFIAQVGIEVDPKGTQITGIKKGILYLSCKMSAKVPTDKLKETFQTEKIKDSEEKKRYRDLQNGKY